MNSKVTIRKGELRDVKAMHSLVVDLATFENAAHEVTNTIEEMERDGFGSVPAFEFLVAETAEEIIGVAVYYIKYSTWKGKGVYLDDIVVRHSFRRQGIGTLLFNALIGECEKLQAKQLHWQVLDWNEQAITFYKKYHASFDDEWIDCKLSAKQLQEFNLNSLRNEGI